MDLHEQKQQHSLWQHVNALPQPLLEKIVVSGTSTQDKKALRQSCKFLQELLDDSLLCIKLAPRGDQDQQIVQRLKNHMQIMRDLKSVIVVAYYNASSLLTHLPAHITTIDLHVTNANLKDLAGLPCLTSLQLRYRINSEDGAMQHITGLTRLHCHSGVGSVAHLAPTLKHLFAWRYDDVQGLDQLTNLEVLDISGGLPADFFETHPDVPLRHLCINFAADHQPFYTAGMNTWRSAPTTLTCLTLDGEDDQLLGMLPMHVTHLQLLFLRHPSIKQAATLLPGLRCLDVSMNDRLANSWENAFVDLDNLTNLLSLGIRIHNDDGICWSRDRVISEVPAVARAIQRGATLNHVATLSEMFGLLNFPCPQKPAWGTSA